MSHFTVAVIWENVSKQLDPFWELDLADEEMKKDKRAVRVDQTKEYKNEREENNKLSNWKTIQKRFKNYENYLKDWHWVEDINKQWYWHNPKAKRDWYEIGWRRAWEIELKDHVERNKYPELNFSRWWDDEQKEKVSKRMVDTAYVRDIKNLKDLEVFAVLYKWVWYEKGKMWRWAIVTDKKEEKDWRSECKDLFSKLNKNIRFTIVCCHI